MAIFQVDMGYPVPECLHSGFCWSRMTEVMVTTGPVRCASSSSQIFTINKPTSSFFYRPDALYCRPTNSVKALKGRMLYYYEQVKIQPMSSILHQQLREAQKKVITIQSFNLVYSVQCGLCAKCLKGFWHAVCDKKVSYHRLCCASAFVIDHVKICLASSLITMQNVVVVSHTVCARVGVLKIWGRWGPTPWNRGVADP